MATATKANTVPDAEELAESFRSQYLASVKEQQKLALDAASQWAEAISKFFPQPAANPYVGDWRQATKANFDFAAQLLAAQREFATNLLEVLAPASA